MRWPSSSTRSSTSARHAGCSSPVVRRYTFAGSGSGRSRRSTHPPRPSSCSATGSAAIPTTTRPSSCVVDSTGSRWRSSSRPPRAAPSESMISCSELDDRFDLLLERRPADRRHATLRATLEWSHDRLTARRAPAAAPARRVRRQLPPAGRGGDLWAARIDLADRRGARLARRQVPRGVRPGPRPSPAPRDRPTLRAERLSDAGEPAAFREAHARWFLDELLAQPWVDVTTLHPFVPDAPNLLAAADWWTLHRTSPRGRRAPVALGRCVGRVDAGSRTSRRGPWPPTSNAATSSPPPRTPSPARCSASLCAPDARGVYAASSSTPS